MSDYMNFISGKVSSGEQFPTEEMNTSRILRNITSLMYEFKDNPVTVDYNGKDSADGTYKKEVSPLFHSEVIDDKDNDGILSTILSFVPYYHREPTNDALELDSEFLQETRDPGINDVPSPLQDDDFYSSWFRDSWGYIQNSMILDAYNKLMYPIINENQYLNAGLFPKIADSIFSSSSESDSESLLRFLCTEEDNDSVYSSDYRYYGEEDGCLDHIDDIINQKILSIYKMIDYVNKQNTIINKWGESLYESGQLNSEDLDSAKTVFKLQDIKNELLRRKFAGSRTIYELSMRSLDRQGSFTTALRYYDLPGKSEGKSYNNKRLIRVLKLPGITSSSSVSRSLGFDILRSYSSSEEIPLDTVMPLFYSSSGSVDIERFLSGGYTDPSDIRKYNIDDSMVSYRNRFLRDGSRTIDWSSIDGVIMESTVNRYAERMDSSHYYYDSNNDPTPLPVDISLDGHTHRTAGSPSKRYSYYEKYDKEIAQNYSNNHVYRNYSRNIRLDISTPLYDMNMANYSVADINADKVLYHRNSIQETMGENYPYVTYPLADNGGPCLIDTYWVDYIEKEIRSKSKVQDTTEIGVQINTLMEMEPSGSSYSTGEHYFFGISFSSEDGYSSGSDIGNVPMEDYTEDSSYALLWYCTLKYDVSEIKISDIKNSYSLPVTSFKKTLISKIKLKQSEDVVSSKYKENGKVLDEYSRFTRYSVGILPMTYPTAIDSVVWNTGLGFYGEGDSQKVVSNDIGSMGFSEAYFMFSNRDLTRNCIDIGKDPADIMDDKKNLYCTSDTPSLDTRVVYFIVNKPAVEKYRAVSTSGDGTTVKYDENGAIEVESRLVDNFCWSDPIRVVHLTDELEENLKFFEPEWMGMGYFLNPYLNFTKESASPLRHRNVKPSAMMETLKKDDQIDAVGGEYNLVYNGDELLYVRNPGEYAALSNLNRTRGMEYVCDDTDICPTEWVKDGHPSSSIKGMYLRRVCPDPGTVSTGDWRREYASIYGDNRKLDAFDFSYEGYDGIVILDGYGIDSEEGIAAPSDADKNKLFIIRFNGKGPYRYFTWVEDQESYREIDEWSVDRKRSSVYSSDDSFNIPCLKISKADSPDGGERDNGEWCRNYLEMSSGQEPVNKWFWNQESNGRAMFFNLKVDSESLHKRCLIVSDRYEEDDDEKDNYSLYISADGGFVFTAGSSQLSSAELLTESSISDNFRVGISLLEKDDSLYDMFLVVNNNSYEIKDISLNINPTSRIRLFSDYKDESSPSVGDWSQENIFYGEIFDMRLYNCGKHPGEMVLLNTGSLRESFSYGPSNYKLANTIYRDSAVLKKVTVSPLETGKIPSVDSIRIFDRSIWDSIMVDNCASTSLETDSSSVQYVEDHANPVSDEDIYKKVEESEGVYNYYLNNCVEQDLMDGIEVFNDLSEGLSNEGDITINYHSASERREVVFNHEYPMTLITTLIEPGDYESDSLYSKDVSFTLQDEDGKKYIHESSGMISIPVQTDQSDDYFVYSADMDLNFRMNSVLDISKWLSRGSNITLEYNSLLDREVARLSDVSLRNSESNHVLLPFVVPSFPSSNGEPEDMCMDRFYASGVVLSNGLSTFLKASSYYSEIQIPVALEKETESYDVLSDFRFTPTGSSSPLEGVTYYYSTDSSALSMESSLRMRMASVSDFYDYHRTLGNDYYLYSRTDSYPEVYEYTPNDTYAYSESNGNFVNMDNGSILTVSQMESSSNITVQYSLDGSSWSEVDYSYPYFRDGLYYRTAKRTGSPSSIVYRYLFGNDPSSPAPLSIGLYRLYTDDSGNSSYASCTGRYVITDDYYSENTTYSLIGSDSVMSLESGIVYYQSEDSSPGVDTEYLQADFGAEEDSDGVFRYRDTVFSSNILYYEDTLSPNRYYCLDDDGKYVYTNVYLPDITTFTEWYDYWKSQQLYEVVSGAYVEVSSFILSRAVSGFYFRKVSNSEVYRNISVMGRNVDRKSVYVNKWDALRVMKEGTYYFTCKYPIQILPFNDDEFDSSTDRNYTTYYASCRMKIEVSGSLKEFEDTGVISGYPSEYYPDSIESTLKSSSQRHENDDNSTFPHRRMTIRLYVMDVPSGTDDCSAAGIMNDQGNEEYKYIWTLVGSNVESETSDSVMYLDRETVESQMVMTSRIPLFLEKNYVSPFFIAGYNRASEYDDPESADDDIVSPIRLSDDENKEKIVSYSESDLDEQVLIYGKSYKILFEYTGRLTEMGFIDRVYSEGESVVSSYEVSDIERRDFSRMVNLMDTGSLDNRDYMYSTDGRSFRRDDVNISDSFSGFSVIEDGEGGYRWEDMYSTIENGRFSLGNPYSRSRSRNYLLKIKNSISDAVSSVKRMDSRQNIDSSFTFPYTVEIGSLSPSEYIGEHVPGYLSYLGVVSGESGNIGRIQNFDEAGVIRAHYEEISGIMKNAIGMMKTQSCGLFMGMSVLSPNYVLLEGSSSSRYKPYEKISSGDFSLYGYSASARLLKVRNDDIYIKRRSLYSNNILGISSFDDPSYWEIRGASSYGYVPDSLWGKNGKDVFQIYPVLSDEGKGTVYIGYSTGKISINSRYEAALNLKDSFTENNGEYSRNNISKVTAHFYSGGVESYSMVLSKVDVIYSGTSEAWFNYSVESDDLIVADTVVYEVEFLKSDLMSFCVTSPIVRKCNILSHYSGLSDVLDQVTSSSSKSQISLLSHTMVVFMNNSNGRYFPIQFNNDIITTVSSNGKTVKRPKSGLGRVSDFISSNSIGTYGRNSKLIELFSPWLRRLYFYSNGSNESESVLIHRYSVRSNIMGRREPVEISSNVNDIYRISSMEDISEVVDAVKSSSGDSYTLTLNKLPIELDSSNRLTLFNMDIPIDEDDPMRISSERFTSLFNCLYPSKYREKNNYPVAVTNIQLMSTSDASDPLKKRKVVYELEYLPVIYSEMKNHLSLNLLLYRPLE